MKIPKKSKNSKILLIFAIAYPKIVLYEIKGGKMKVSLKDVVDSAKEKVRVTIERKRETHSAQKKEKLIQEKVTDAYAMGLSVALSKAFLGEVRFSWCNYFFENYRNRKYLTRLIQVLKNGINDQDKKRVYDSLCRFYCDLNI